MPDCHVIALPTLASPIVRGSGDGIRSPGRWAPTYGLRGLGRAQRSVSEQCPTRDGDAQTGEDGKPEDDPRGPLAYGAGTGADQCTPDQEEGEVGDRQAYGNNEKDETDQHGARAQCKHP
jgi:hypothetical protein